jgi:hypothetical protein
LLAAARDCGVSSLVSSGLFNRDSSLLRTSPAARRDGLMRSCETWRSEAMRRYRSRCRQAMSVLRTSELACSSLRATLTATGNLLAPSMQKWKGHRALLPTLTATDYGSNQGGAAGRNGPVRESLDKMARNKMGTLTANCTRRSSKFAASTAPSPIEITGGRPLSLQWCEWFMGFPEGYTALGDELSATASSPSAPRSSDTSSGS